MFKGNTGGKPKGEENGAENLFLNNKTQKISKNKTQHILENFPRNILIKHNSKR